MSHRDSMQITFLTAWKRKTLNMNRGIALVALDSMSTPLEEAVQAIKKRTGKHIGYLPFLYELGLQLVLIGRGVLEQATGLGQLVDSRSRLTVTLQSIHLVDVAAGELIHHLPDADVEAKSALPGWARTIEIIGKIKNPFATGFLRGKSRFRYSVVTGRAALSVRTWGQTRTGPFIDAQEEGIDKFIHTER